MTPWVSSILVIERHLQGKVFILSQAFKTLCENRLQVRKITKKWLTRGLTFVAKIEPVIQELRDVTPDEKTIIR